MLLKGELEEAQLEGFPFASLPSAIANPRRIIFDETNGQILISDGTAWIAAAAVGANSINTPNYVDGSITAPKLASGSVTGSKAAAGFGLLPSGSIVPYAGTSAPTGYLLCDGSSYLRSAYPTLFAAIGTAYGAADGTHFNVPDFRGRFLRGVDGSAGRDPDTLTRTAMNPGGNTGNNVGSVEADAFQGHIHNATYGGSGGFGVALGTGSNASGPTVANGVGISTPITDGINGTPRTAAETRPVNAYVNYIILI